MKYIILSVLIILALSIACIKIKKCRIWKENNVIIEKCNDVVNPRDRVNCIAYEAKKQELLKN